MTRNQTWTAEDRALAIHKAAQRVRHYERQLRAAIVERDAAIVEHHGPQRDGFLSYADIVAETGMSRTRVIQIVHGARDAEGAA